MNDQRQIEPDQDIRATPTPIGTRTQSEQRGMALELKKQGLSYGEIAAQLGCSERRALADVRQALRQVARYENELALELRNLEAQRLDMAAIALAPRVVAGTLEAIDRWLAISRLRAKLLGLEKPAMVPEGIARPPLKIMVQYVDGDGDA